MKIREGDWVVTPRPVDEWEAQRAAALGWFEAVGATQADVMLRAKQDVGTVMVRDDRERLACRRLVARGLMRRHFPDGRFYDLTARGQECWLLVRGAGE